MSARLLIIVPCFNEARSISRLLDKIEWLRGHFSVPCEVLVVDDASTDDTFAVANEKTLTVRLPANLGIGGAVQTGIKYALLKNYSHCIQIDGDGQHPPSEIPRLWEAMQSSGANVLIGSRFMEGRGYQSTAARRMGIRLIRSLLNVTTGLRITDPTSGMRLLDAKAIRFFANEYPQDFPEPVSIASGTTSGLSVREISVEMAERETGQSSISSFKSVSYMVRVSLAILLQGFRRMIS